MPDGRSRPVRGLKRGIRRQAEKEGVRVLVHYGRSAPEAEHVVAVIDAKGGRAHAIPADRGIPDGTARLAEQIRAIAGDWLDVLVSNVGVSKAARIAGYPVETFDDLSCTHPCGSGIP
jgi:NAD(P)-dependent dehydrogenase (short-subunit alcohol dehydrogenase family)